MSLTLTKVRDSEDVWGKTRTVVYDIQFDSSYPLSAGYTLNAQDVGLKNFFDGSVVGGNKAAGAVAPHLEFSLGLPISSAVLRLFLPSGGATAPATLTAPVAGGGAGTIVVSGTATGTIPAGATAVTSTSASPAVSVPATGLTAAFTPGAGGAITAGIGKEVGNTTDVSSITVRVRFFGN